MLRIADQTPGDGSADQGGRQAPVDFGGAGTAGQLSYQSARAGAVDDLAVFIGIAPPPAPSRPGSP